MYQRLKIGVRKPLQKGCRFYRVSAVIIGFYTEFSSLLTLLAGVAALALLVSILLGK